MGKERLQDVCGDTELLTINGSHLDRMNRLNLDLSFFLQAPAYIKSQHLPGMGEPVNSLNARLLADLEKSIDTNESVEKSYSIINTDRSAMATLFGHLAKRVSIDRLSTFKSGTKTDKAYKGKIQLNFQVVLAKALEFSNFRSRNPIRR